VTINLKISFIIKDFFICGYGHRTCKNVAERIGDIILLTNKGPSILVDIKPN
jgi:hypothetical protein